MPLWWAVAGGVLGAIVGSFLATLVIRWPAGRSVVAGRSRCDGCGRTLRVWELIPLLSFMAVRGRCRTCGAPIARGHVAIEAAAAVIGGLALGLAPGPSGLVWGVFGWWLLTLAVLDARHFWLPDRLTLPLAGAGLAVGGFATGVALLDRGIGAAIGYVTLAAIGWTYRRVRGRDGLGGGDAKLLGAIGAWVGWQALPFVLLAASVLGLLAALLSGGLRRDRMVPFGTALAAGVLPGWCALRLLGG